MDSAHIHDLVAFRASDALHWPILWSTSNGNRLDMRLSLHELRKVGARG